MARFGIITFVAFLITSLSGCQKDEKIFLEKGKDIEIFSYTKVIADDDFARGLLEIDSVNFTYAFSEELINEYNISSGDILVSSLGNGMLRWVDSLAAGNGQYIVYTSQATLEDMIRQGSISHRQTLKPSMIQKIVYHVEGVKLQPVEGDNDGDTVKLTLNHHLGSSVYLSGEFYMLSQLIFELQIDWLLRLQKFKYGFEHKTYTSIGVSSGYSFNFNPKITIATLHFTPIVVPAGPVPIVIVPKVEVDIGLDGRAQATISTSLTHQLQYETGIQYQKEQGWSAYDSVINQWNFQPPTAVAEASFRAYVTPRISLMVYNVLGAYLDASIYSEIEVDLFDTPWWVLYAGYRVGIGAKAMIMSKNLVDKSYPELLANKWVVAQADNEAPLETGTVKGVVRDAITQQGLQGVNVLAYKGAEAAGSTITNADGSYELVLTAPVQYRFLFEKTGYLPEEYFNINVEVDQVYHLGPVLQIDQAHDGEGNISGRVVNAFNGQGIAGAQIKVRKGINAQSGQILATITSMASGNYALEQFPAGNYTLEVNADGFNTAFAGVYCLGGQTIANQNVSLTPIIDDDEIRIILDWGLTPADLDSHLTGPVPGGSNRFHIYYSNKNFFHGGELYAALDYDVINSYGPETTTIYVQTSGVYRFSVHDYTNRNSTTSSALSNSNARVRVFKGSDLLQTYHVPSNIPGTLWTVFELNGNNLIPVNTMSFVAAPGNVTKDGKTK